MKGFSVPHDSSRMNSFARALVACTLGLFACGGTPIVVAVEPPPPPVDAGSPGRVFPTSMGDPFGVDAPVPSADNGVRAVTTAFDGQMHLVVWRSALGLLATRFDLAGNRLDATPLQIAPPKEITGGIFAGVHPQGGFVVRWMGPQFFGGSTVAVPGYGQLNESLIGRTGEPEVPRALLGRLSDTAQVFEASGQPLVLSVDASLGHLRAGQARISIPQLIATPVAYALVGTRQVVVVITGDANTRRLELRELVNTTTTLITSIPLELSGFGTEKDVVLRVMGDKGVLIWRDSLLEQEGRKVLYAVTVSTGATGEWSVSAPVELMRAQPAGRGDVMASIVGSRLLVGVRGIISNPEASNVPVAITLDPNTSEVGPGIDGPPSYRNARLFDCSWDGQACLSVLGIGDLWSYAIVERVSLGSAVSDPQAERALLGQVNEQSSPSVSCNARQCLMTWADARTIRGEVRGVRVDATTGHVSDAQSFALMTPSSAGLLHQLAVARLKDSFVVAQTTCSPFDASAASTMQVHVRVVPPEGEPKPVQVIDLGVQCDAWEKLVAVGDSDRAMVAALYRDLPGGSEGHSHQLVLVSVDGAGQATLRPHSIPQHDRYAFSDVDLVLRGDETAVALRAGQYWTTALLSPRSDVTGLAAQCAHDFGQGFCPQGPRRLYQVPGTHRLGWLGLETPKRFGLGVDDWALTWTELDDRALPAGPPITLFGARGSVGDFRMVADDRGLSVLTTERTFASEDYSLVLRRFDALPTAMGVRSERVVAEGVFSYGMDLASCGSGQWLVSWPAGGASRGNLILIGAPVSRVLGRFVYEAP